MIVVMSVHLHAYGWTLYETSGIVANYSDIAVKAVGYLMDEIYSAVDSHASTHTTFISAKMRAASLQSGLPVF